MPPPRKRPSASRKRPAAAGCSDPPHKKPAAATLEVPSSVQIPELDVCTIYKNKPFVGRETMLGDVQNHLRQIPSKYQEEGKLPMLGCSGMKGIGKTAMLVQIALTVAPQMGKKGLYMTFNGESELTNTFHRALKRSKTLAEAFAIALLVRCGCNEDDACDAHLGPTIEWLRQKLCCTNEDTLVICVDEIGHLQGQVKDPTFNMPSATMSSVMDVANTFKGQVVFIFSHIEDSVLLEGASGSGRQVLSLHLPALPPSVWKELTQLHKWQNAASLHAAIHQLLLACCGHPRCLVDGLPAALLQRPSLLEDPTEPSLIVARDVIIKTSKFNDIANINLQKVIFKWFSVNQCQTLDVDALIANGLLLQLPGKVNVLNPLVLQSWATGEDTNVPMRWHLSQVYDADAVLGPTTEKKMESLMFHYEALLRIGLDGQKIPLREFYDGGHIDSRLGTTLVTALLPSVKDLTAKVANFNDIDSILEQLRDGWIVVSQELTEPGVEYLAPWDSHGKLLVAAVQCKFVKSKVAWLSISQKLQAVKDSLNSKGVSAFSVVYATPDQDTIQAKPYQNGVYFTESGLFQFTKKLGILRLHVMKLGAALKAEYPWLEGSQVQETEVQQMQS